MASGNNTAHDLMVRDTITSATHPTENEEDEEDPFATLLTLEDQYHTSGYNLGLADGSRAGRIEGRLFGLEKGFTKFAEIGKLSGRAAVWQARLLTSATSTMLGESRSVDADDSTATGKVATLSGSSRLRKHIERLAELTDPESLETKNTEDAVNEADERLAGAQAKFTLISRIVGEADNHPHSSAETDVAGHEAVAKGKAKGNGEMEDFVGLPQVGKKSTG